MYRLDRAAPTSLKLTTQKVNVGSQVYVIGTSLGMLEKSIFQGIVSGVRRAGDQAHIQFDAAISSGNSGSPLLNKDGEVIGMAQASLSEGESLNFGISSFNMVKYLSENTPAKLGALLGKLGQATQNCEIHELPDPASKVYSTAEEHQFLILVENEGPYYKVLMSNGVHGYARKDQLTITEKTVRRQSIGIANGSEIKRIVESYDESKLRETSKSAAWLSECAHFVCDVFAAAGREISADVNIQLDIGRPVERLEHLAVGDRVYFKGPRAAIYVGEGHYMSVSKQGKLVKGPFDAEARKQLIAARH